MAYKVIRYHCNFCKKTYTSKSYCEKHHEPICFMNPLRESCGTCKHYDWFGFFEFQKCNIDIDISEKQRVHCYKHALKETE